MAKILVIDDDTNILELVSRCLEAEGHEVATATSGQQGLKIATKGRNQPNLIILDVHMAGMDGLQVLEKIKDHRKTHAIPVLMFTGDSDTDIMQRAMRNYAMEFITKPIAMNELARKVANALAYQ
jgi:CheY-like chemotaxis protein